MGNEWIEKACALLQDLRPLAPNSDTAYVAGERLRNDKWKLRDRIDDLLATAPSHKLTGEGPNEG